jgi:hypothetical protein
MTRRLQPNGGVASLGGQAKNIVTTMLPNRNGNATGLTQFAAMSARQLF